MFTSIFRSFRVSPLVFVWAATAAVLGAGLVGCAGQNVGPRFTDSGGVAGPIEHNTPSPNVLDIVDADKRGYLTGTGPGQYTSLNADGLQTFKTGSVPREIYWDGATKRLTLSSGSDIAFKGVEFDQSTGLLKVAEFSTISSEPIRALNEALDRLAPVWAQMTEAEKEAFIAESNNIRASFGDILKAALDAAAGL